MKPPPPFPFGQAALVAGLREKLAQCEESHRLPAGLAPISTGAACLDRLLPAGGLRPGSLVEYLAAEPGQGARSLALLAARAACQEVRTLVVLDRQRQFYPPAAAAWGVDLSRTLVLRPATQAEELWAVDQALRCPGVGAVWVACGSLGVRDFRRWQLAAESGGTLGLLIRPARVRGQPTWADAQWLVEPQPSREQRQLRVELVRCRGGTGSPGIHLELDEQTGAWSEASHSHAAHSLYSPAKLAAPATVRRRSRA